MPYKLTYEQMNGLLEKPETGMGYQYVEASMHDYSSLRGIVLNAEVFIPENRIDKIIGVSFHKYTSILNEAEQSGYIRRLNIISKSNLHLGETRHFTKASKSPASESGISYSQKNDVFKRFSPFLNDHRVNSDGSLKQGSYATTEADARNVTTGIQATLRYALPSDDPAIYVFTIIPPEMTPVRIGQVEPANGKPGGGVEVLFEQGSPKNTVTGPIQIREK